MFTVYVINCTDRAFKFVGFTSDYTKRITQQREGKGANFVKVAGFRNAHVVGRVGTLVDAKRLESLAVRRFLKHKGWVIAGSGWTQADQLINAVKYRVTVSNYTLRVSNGAAS